MKNEKGLNSHGNGEDIIVWGRRLGVWNLMDVLVNRVDVQNYDSFRLNRTDGND
jgi:hypothetical protein